MTASECEHPNGIGVLAHINFHTRTIIARIARGAVALVGTMSVIDAGRILTANARVAGAGIVRLAAHTVARIARVAGALAKAWARVGAATERAAATVLDKAGVHSVASFAVASVAPLALAVDSAYLGEAVSTGGAVVDAHCRLVAVVDHFAGLAITDKMRVACARPFTLARACALGIAVAATVVDFAQVVAGALLAVTEPCRCAAGAH